MIARLKNYLATLTMASVTILAGAEAAGLSLLDNLHEVVVWAGAASEVAQDRLKEAVTVIGVAITGIVAYVENAKEKAALKVDEISEVAVSEARKLQDDLNKAMSGEANE